MNELLVLISEGGTRREVFAKSLSIGSAEFYQAAATNHRPELKVCLADYFDYAGERYAEHDSTLYRVIRTYRAGQQMELTLTRASAEEVELYGTHHD